MCTSKIILSIVASVTVASIASAGEFQVFGNKAASMGGAGIAKTPSALAAYNNPALLGSNGDKLDIHVGVGVGVKDFGAAKPVSDLNSLNFSELQDAADGNADNLTVDQITALDSARHIVLGMNGKGISMGANADFGVSYGSFGTGVFASSDMGAKANILQTHTDLIFETSAPGTYVDITTGNAKTLAEYQASSMDYAIKNGDTNLEIIGLVLTEVPLAYGHSINTDYGQVSIGGALKFMQGKTFYKNVELDSEDSFDNLDQNTKTSKTFGVDLGLSYVPNFDTSLTLALVGKNLNNPKFNTINSLDIKIDPAVRAGAAYRISDWADLAFDVDLTENKTVNGYKNRYVGGGINFDLTYIGVSAGLMKNISNDDTAGLVYTAGLSTGPSWLTVALTAQMASNSVEYDGNKYPKHASAVLSISSTW
jgi:hypothetical protein